MCSQTCYINCHTGSAKQYKVLKLDSLGIGLLKTVGSANIIIIVAVIAACIVALLILIVVIILICRKKKPNDKCKFYSSEISIEVA